MIAQPHQTRPTLEEIRSHFPALESGFAFLENAGGSQVPSLVIDGMAKYMRENYVQLGAGYERSVIATQTVDAAHAFANLFMGAEDKGRVVLGSSATGLIHMLSSCYGEVLPKGSRIIVAETAHEANFGPWHRLAKWGFDLQTWRVDPATFQCSQEELEELLKAGTTKILAFPHVSNLLGEIVDVEAITALAHRYGARVVVDGVAYAPHRLIEAAKWGVDYYVFSWYKVYGPHMAALYGTHDAFNDIEGPNHFFVERDIPYKFELGGVSHEGCAGLLGTGEYFKSLGGGLMDETLTRQHVVDAYSYAAELEIPLQRAFVQFLKAKPGVKILGPAHGEDSRVSTISFVHERLSPPKIVEAVHRHPVGIRYGNAYAYRLCQALRLDPETGVVRASFVHYNTVDEVDRLIRALEPVL